MRLLIVRHAQSANNAGIDPRVSDPHLTGLGERQADLVAEALLAHRIDLLYVSPMRRTLQTAAPISAATGLPARVFTGLHEWGGVWEERVGVVTHLPGLGRAEIEALIPGVVLPEDVAEDGWWRGDPDLPALELAWSNAFRFLDYLATTYSDDVDVAVVTHGGFGSNLIEAALGLDQLRDRIRFVLNNTGYSMIEVAVRERWPHWHNRIDHLPPDLIT